MAVRNPLVPLAVALAVLAAVFVMVMRDSKPSLSESARFGSEFVPLASELPSFQAEASPGRRLTFPLVPKSINAKAAALTMSEKFRQGRSLTFSAIVPNGSTLAIDGAVAGREDTRLFVTNYVRLDDGHVDEVKRKLHDRLRFVKTGSRSLAVRGPVFYGVLLDSPTGIEGRAGYGFELISEDSLLLEGSVNFPDDNDEARKEALRLVGSVIGSIREEQGGPPNSYPQPKGQ